MPHPKSNLLSYFRVLTLASLLLSAPLLKSSENLTDFPEVNIITEQLPPYQFIDDNNRIQGYSVELVKEILDEAGINQSIQLYPWARTYKLATTRKNVIVFSLARIPDRESKFIWIGQLHEETYNFLTAKTNKDLRIKSLDEAKKYSIAVTRSSVADHLLTRLGFEHLEKTASFDQCIAMVIKNRIDLILASKHAIKYRVTNSKLVLENLISVFELKGHSTGLYLAMSADSDPQLVDKLKTAFETIKSRGTIEKLKRQWEI